MRLELAELCQRIKQHPGQLCLNIWLTILVGATLSVAKFSDALIAGTGKKYLYQVPKTVVSTSFLISFGVTKAISNLIVGIWSDKRGRREPNVSGWLFGCILPIIVMLVKSWGPIAFANVFLGIQQGLCWSTLIFMMVDYAGKKNAGLAAGLNETVGYTSIAIFTLVAGSIVDQEAKNYQQDPYYVVMALMLAGLLSSALLLKDSLPIVQRDARKDDTGFVNSFRNDDSQQETQTAGSWREVFKRVSWRDRDTCLLCIGGLVINLITGLAWGLFTKWMNGGSPGRWHFDGPTDVAKVLFLYDFFKGFTQFIAGYLGDRMGARKYLLAVGFIICATCLGWLAFSGLLVTGLTIKVHFRTAAFGLGLGTGIVYPNLLAAISDQMPPTQRAQGLGAYRFWRDLGYAVGGLLGGLIQDASHSYPAALLFGGALAAASALLILAFYREPYHKARIPKTDVAMSQDVNGDQAVKIMGEEETKTNHPGVETVWDTSASQRPKDLAAEEFKNLADSENPDSENPDPDSDHISHRL
eukprot:g23277.t1